MEILPLQITRWSMVRQRIPPHLMSVVPHALEICQVVAAQLPTCGRKLRGAGRKDPTCLTQESIFNATIILPAPVATDTWSETDKPDTITAHMIATFPPHPLWDGNFHRSPGLVYADELRGLHVAATIPTAHLNAELRVLHVAVTIWTTRPVIGYNARQYLLPVQRHVICDLNMKLCSSSLLTVLCNKH